MRIKKTAIEVERAFWARTAKHGHWFEEPFFVQIWIDKDGKIQDSVSFKGLDSDRFLEWESNKIISPEIID